MPSFRLENPERVSKLVTEGWRCPAYNFSIQMDAQIFIWSTVNNGREWLRHPKGKKESGDMGHR